jgi:TetR/AcrR family transcriptional regulator, tetracycline repressor protein
MAKSSADSTARSSLSPHDILRVAISIADGEGIDAVSMRRVAREQSVTPMALYWHFEDKDRLLDAMAERVVAEAEFNDLPDAAWEDRYRAVLTILVSLLRTHPWMGRLLIERLVPLPKYLAALEIMLDCARVAGLTPRTAAMVVQQVVQSVVALAEYEPKRVGTEPSVTAAEWAEFAETLDPNVFPNVRAAVEPLTTPDKVDDYYRLGIDMIVGGLHAVAESTSGQ